jgi:hypothetical protein
MVLFYSLEENPMKNNNLIEENNSENDPGGRSAARAGGNITNNYKTLTIHPDDRSTDDLMLVYENIDTELIINTVTAGPLHDRVAVADRTLCLGHGVPQGLIGGGMRLCIDESFVPLFQQQPDNIYIWCNADCFMQRHGLSGFATGMFISEPMEARVFNVTATPEELTSSNRLFCRLVNDAIKAGMNNEETAEYVLRHYDDPASEVIEYNRVRLGSYRDGVLTRNYLSAGQSPDVDGEMEYGYIGAGEIGQGLEARLA